MPYVDGFVLAVPRDRLEEYNGHARLAGKVWMEHGALSYVEAVADDVPYGDLTSFPRAVQCKDDEVVVFAYVTYESRARRDEVMKKVFEDSRLSKDMASLPFDGKRMIYGGFDSFMAL